MSEETSTAVAVAEAHPMGLTKAETDWRLAERQALAISKGATAVPKAFAGKPADIMAVWMMADELGLSRMAALRGMYVVSGKPQLSGDLLMAVARGAGCQVEETMREVDGEAGEPLKLTAVCKVKRADGEVITAEYSVEDAQLAGLWGQTDVWRKYPRRMLQMRARGFALRDAVPDKLAGVYAPGEIIDVTPDDIDG